ncbi:MAG TPA: enoyl-CoA hydratase-related protein [Candidatus Limnocylindria bacterium]|nr:enoyl-CoA hydratase-related protein [Candidatus Limnocylindria bacterium]
MSCLIEIERDGPIARLWLNRPEQHNALSPELGAELVTALHGLAHEDRVRVVVLGGRGPSFCAGADIAAMKASTTMTFDENLAEAEKLAGMFAALADLPKPVVARVHGSVFGGGVGLTCASDIAVSTDDARFGLTEVRLGILPAVIGPYVIRRLGDAFARELMLTGERFDAQTALRVHMVQHVVPAAALDAKVDERVEALLAGAPGAQRRIKMQLELFGDAIWDEFRAATPRVLAEVRSGEEARDGLTAFFEKRKPSWHVERARA